MNRRKITNIEIELGKNNIPIIKITSEKPLSKNSINLINEEVAEFMFYGYNTVNKDRLLSNLANTLCFEGKRLYSMPQGFNFQSIEWFDKFESQL